jgi:hypothetical protein
VWPAARLAITKTDALPQGIVIRVALEEALACVRWSRLSHAYGSADDLPVLITRRASRDEATARAASHRLWDTVWHQGTVYEASAAAVPALAMLAGDTATVDRLDLVLLLSSIATGRSYAVVHGIGGDDQRAQELRWVAEAHQAVAAAAPSLLGPLATEPRVLRLGLAVLASAVPEQSAPYVPALRRECERAATPEERQLFAAVLVALVVREPRYLEELAEVESDKDIKDHVTDEAMEDLGALLRGDSLHDCDLLFDLVGRAQKKVHADGDARA